MNESYKLCFVKDDTAYFTTQDVTQQTGDDWNDAPYEHNAGIPYRWDERRGVPKYEIATVMFEADMETPASNRLNSPYCVDEINAGAVPWLKTPNYYTIPVWIMAGASFPEFCKSIWSVGGDVYTPLEKK